MCRWGRGIGHGVVVYQLMRTFISRVLTRVFQNSYGASLYLRYASALDRLPAKIEHQSGTVSARRDIMQGVLNSAVIPFHLNRIWPHWVYRQLNPQSLHYSSNGLPFLAVNATHRNWTTLSFPGVNEQAIVDPTGLLTPIPGSWSMDFWVTQDDRLVAPSKLADVRQELIQNLPMVQTSFSLKESLDVSSVAWFTPDLHLQGYVFNRVTLKNTSSEPLQTSLFFAVRPYNPEGISPVSEITYLSEQGLVVDDRLGIVFDQRPDNVVCLTFADGDVSEHYSEWEMILHAHCGSKMASAFVQYKLSLAPGEEKSFTAKLPTTPIAPLRKFFQKTLKIGQREALLHRIRGLRSMNVEEYRGLFEATWQDCFKSLGQLSLPDKKLESLLTQNLAHLHSFVGEDKVYSQGFSIHEAPIYEKIYLILSLNRCGASAVAQNLLSKLPYFKNHAPIRFLKGEQAGQLLYVLNDTFQYTRDLAFLETHFSHVERMVKKLKSYASKWSLHKGFSDRISRLFRGFTAQEEYMYGYFWAMAGLKSATQIADALHRTDRAAYFHGLYTEMVNALQMLFLFSMGSVSRSTFIPVSTKRLVDSGLVMSLVSVYPLGMMSPHDERVERTLDLLEQFLVNQVLFTSIGHSGFNVFQNCQLAQVYALRQDPTAHHILSWIVTHVSTTGTWPETLHPISFGGSGGDGHSGLACAEFIHLVRNLLVRRDGDVLHFCPFIPPAWIEGEGVVAQQWPTSFGVCSFGMRREGNQVIFRVEPEFSFSPVELRVSLPIPFKEVSVGGQTMSASAMSEQGYIRLEPRAQDVIFVL